MCMGSANPTPPTASPKHQGVGNHRVEKRMEFGLLTRSKITELHLTNDLQYVDYGLRYMEAKHG